MSDTNKLIWINEKSKTKIILFQRNVFNFYPVYIKEFIINEHINKYAQLM